MPFPAMFFGKSSGKLDDFRNHNDFIQLYKSYTWDNDCYENSFSNILQLEQQLRKSDLTSGISLKDVRSVAKWACLKTWQPIDGCEIVLPHNCLHYENRLPHKNLEILPLMPIDILRLTIYRRNDLTFMSQILRFGLPEEYGILDPKCVAIFGWDHLNWMDSKISSNVIPLTQPWLYKYGFWISILRYFASKLEEPCPHPKPFIESGLRSNGKWTCADVGMALFSYACSSIIFGQKTMT